MDETSILFHILSAPPPPNIYMLSVKTYIQYYDIFCQEITSRLKKISITIHCYGTCTLHSVYHLEEGVQPDILTNIKISRAVLSLTKM